MVPNTRFRACKTSRQDFRRTAAMRSSEDLCAIFRAKVGAYFSTVYAAWASLWAFKCLCVKFRGVWTAAKIFP